MQRRSGPRQPWLHDRVVATRAPATVVSGPDGDITCPADGVYVDDRRVLSHLRLWLDDEPAVAVAAAAVGERADLLLAARHLGDPGPDPTVQVHRRRTVTADGMREHLEVTSRSPTPLRLRLRLAVAGDGADLGTVKAGLADDGLARPLAAGRGTQGIVWSDDRHRTVVSTVPEPSSVRVGTTGTPTELEFDLDVVAGSTAVVELTVTARRVAATAFDAGPGHLDWHDVAVQGPDPALGRMVQQSLQDLQGLLLGDPQDPRDVFVAAGSPWYLTLFGRDALWSARFMLPFGTSLAGGTLRALARRQGTGYDGPSQEEPGRILHEVRRDTFSDATAGLVLPPVYYGTVDATALWLCLLVDAWRHGLPEAEVRELLPAARAAFDWLRRTTGRRPDGLLAYAGQSGGLANQGWKDSVDAMRRADGSLAPAPIALVEAQGYAVEAALGGASMLTALGEPGAEEWGGFGNALAQRIRDTFWTGSPSCPAMAVAGDGTLVDGVGSNMGHLLVAGALNTTEVRQVVDRLTAPDMLGEFGIRTLSRDNPAHNPLGYHTGSVWAHDTAIAALGMSRQGRGEQATRVATSLLRAAACFDGRCPELFAGDAVLKAPAPYPAACRPQGWAAAAAGAVVTAMLGLDIDVPGRRVTLDPAVAGPLTVRGLRFAGESFEVVVPAVGPPRLTGLSCDVVVRCRR